MRARMASVATVLQFHAHPDDEVLLTGGTLPITLCGRERAGLLAWPGSCWRYQSRCSGSDSGENGLLNRALRQEPCDATFWRLADMIPPVRI